MKYLPIINDWKNISVVIIIPANGLALCGDWTSAGTVRTETGIFLNIPPDIDV